MLHLQWVHISRLMIFKYLSALSDALKAMPNLTSFQIGRIEYLLVEGVPFEPCTTFPPLPMLRNIRAQLPALQMIVPGSPVSSISITEEDIVFEGPVPYEKDVGFWKSVAEVFKKSQRAIEELDVPMSFYCNVSFASHFPDLWLLTIRPKHINWFDKDDAADGPFGGQPDTVCIFPGDHSRGLLLINPSYHLLDHCRFPRVMVRPPQANRARICLRQKIVPLSRRRKRGWHGPEWRFERVRRYLTHP